MLLLGGSWPPREVIKPHMISFIVIGCMLTGRVIYLGLTRKNILEATILSGWLRAISCATTFISTHDEVVVSWGGGRSYEITNHLMPSWWSRWHVAGCPVVCLNFQVWRGIISLILYDHFKLLRVVPNACLGNARLTWLHWHVHRSVEILLCSLDYVAESVC